MKIKLLILIMLLGFGASAQYVNVGANGISRQVASGDTTFRHNLGAAGFLYTKSLANYKSLFTTLAGYGLLKTGQTFRVDTANIVALNPVSPQSGGVSVTSGLNSQNGSNFIGISAFSGAELSMGTSDGGGSLNIYGFSAGSSTHGISFNDFGVSYVTNSTGRGYQLGYNLLSFRDSYDNQSYIIPNPSSTGVNNYTLPLNSGTLATTQNIADSVVTDKLKLTTPPLTDTASNPSILTRASNGEVKKLSLSAIDSSFFNKDAYIFNGYKKTISEVNNIGEKDILHWNADSVIRVYESTPERSYFSLKTSIKGQWSYDNGKTWGTEFTVYDSINVADKEPVLYKVGNAIYVAFMINNSATTDVGTMTGFYITRSFDLGATWAVKRRFSSPTPGRELFPTSVKLWDDGKYRLSAWQYSNIAEVWESSDGWNWTFQTEPYTSLTVTPPQSLWEPVMEVENGGNGILISRDQSGGAHPMFKTSNYGTTWTQVNTNLSFSTGANATRVGLVKSGNDLIVMSGTRNSNGTINNNVYIDSLYFTVDKFSDILAGSGNFSLKTSVARPIMSSAAFKGYPIAEQVNGGNIIGLISEGFTKPNVYGGFGAMSMYGFSLHKTDKSYSLKEITDLNPNGNLILNSRNKSYDIYSPLPPISPDSISYRSNQGQMLVEQFSGMKPSQSNIRMIGDPLRPARTTIESYGISFKNRNSLDNNYWNLTNAYYDQTLTNWISDDKTISALAYGHFASTGTHQLRTGVPNATTGVITWSVPLAVTASTVTAVSATLSNTTANTMLRVNGSKLVVSAVANTDYLPVNNAAMTGSPTSASAPTTANGLLRLTDLGTGWANYVDNVYTTGSPLTVNSGVTSTLTNNASTVLNTQIPIGVTSFYDSATSKITPQLNGDSYLINVRFKARSNNANGLLDVLLDIGGTLNVIDAETVSLRKGTGVEQQVNVVFDIYSAATFLANGGLIKVNSIVGNTEIYDIQYKITRTHKAK